jgi:hypothetical protein
VRRLLGSCAVALLGSAPVASAQSDIVGSYSALFHEDQPERIPGPALGDYLGLPINEAARAFAEAWDASRLTVPEHQCRAHSAPYILRGPLNMRIWDERHPETQQVVAIHVDISNFQQRRTIWMDGRGHPSANAEHTWMGYSTGRWDGGTLVVTTTHIKQMWHRRNGLPQSDRTTLTERFFVRGSVMTYVSIADDPVYLTEPLVKSTNMLRNLTPLLPQQLLYPCTSVVELADQPRGAVPHYLPGANPFLKEFATEHNLPEEAMRGGAETMYPEFRARLRPKGAAR